MVTKADWMKMHDINEEYMEWICWVLKETGGKIICVTSQWR